MPARCISPVAFIARTAASAGQKFICSMRPRSNASARARHTTPMSLGSRSAAPPRSTDARAASSSPISPHCPAALVTATPWARSYRRSKPDRRRHHPRRRRYRLPRSQCSQRLSAESPRVKGATSLKRSNATCADAPWSNPSWSPQGGVPHGSQLSLPPDRGCHQRRPRSAIRPQPARVYIPNLNHACRRRSPSIKRSPRLTDRCGRLYWSKPRSTSPARLNM